MKKYTDELITDLVAKTVSLSDFIRSLGIQTSGNYYSLFKNRIINLELDTTHWLNPLKKQSKNVETLSRKALKCNLIIKRGHICQRCNLDEWLGELITLEVHHIDGDNLNNKESNLQLLCPNCHSQTDNWRGKKLRLQPNTCLDCGKIIHNKAQRCKTCAGRSSSLTPRKLKFEISKEELVSLLDKYPKTVIGKMFGVSDNALKKRAIKLGIMGS